MSDPGPLDGHWSRLRKDESGGEVASPPKYIFSRQKYIILTTDYFEAQDSNPE